MARFRRTSRAEEDLTEIWLFIAADSPDSADRVLDGLDAACRRLGQYPGLGRLRPELGTCIRSYPVGSYVIIYRPGSSETQILRILHGARDIPNELKS